GRSGLRLGPARVGQVQARGPPRQVLAGGRRLAVAHEQDRGGRGALAASGHGGRPTYPDPVDSLARVTADIVSCTACPRLVAWREQVATEKRAAFADEEYWGRPVPGFGDPAATLVIVGLAPAAH